MASASTSRTADALPARLAAGVVGGLTGGVAFGVLMQTMGMLAMVAMLVGGESVGVGWLVHLAISALLGAGFAAVAGAWASGLAAAVGLGAVYGLVWWVLGALTLMPARLGMQLFTVNTAAWQSLMGHLLYGLILGAVFAVTQARLRHG